MLVASPDRFAEISRVLTKWELSSAIIGRITDDGVVRIRDRDEVHVEVPVTFFVDECPVYHVRGDEPEHIRTLRERSLTDVPDIAVTEIAAVLVRMLESPALGSRRSIWEQYDHTIQTNTVLGPGGADAAVIRIKGTTLAIAATMDCNSRYCYLDPYRGAQLAVAEATRNISCVGATPLGLTNCLNFGNPERSPGDWQLRESVRGLGDAARALSVPVVSGNVSLYNETHQDPIRPTPMIGCVGIVPDVSSTAGVRWKDGDVILLLNGASPTLGASDYLEITHGLVAGAPTEPDLQAELRVQRLVRQVVEQGLCSGMHDVSDGGLAVSLAEFAIGTGIGAAVKPAGADGRLDVTWFGEGHARVLVAVDPSHVAEVQELAKRSDVPMTELGRAGGDRLSLGDAGGIPVEHLAAASGRALGGTRTHAHI